MTGAGRAGRVCRVLLMMAALPLLTGISPIKGPTDTGNDAYLRGGYDEAVGHYREAVEADPDRPETHYNLGNAYYKQGGYAAAAKEYREAARLGPDSPDTHYNLGNSLFRMGRYEDALKEYRRAEELYKTDPDTEDNIKVTQKRIKKKRDRKNSGSGKDGRKGKDAGGRDGPQKPGGDAGGQADGQTNEQAGGRAAGRAAGPQTPPLSNEEVQSLIDRQGRSEKRLRNYFRPGGNRRGDTGDEIERMLRGFGLSGVGETGRRPGAPHVEKDW